VDIHSFFASDERKDLLRLLTCGSVDDGKSTLIGRLLYDSKLLYEDHLAALERDSVRRGSAGGDMDYSLLLDGLKAEREQGITIDVAYRFFATPRRKFIIADTPGHEQYTRNMATGASTADLAVILIDARQGVLPQTRRHSFIASLLGIRHLVVAVNKMDLVGYRQEVFERIRGDYFDFATRLEIGEVACIPISALKGDNVVTPGPNLLWYQGEPLLPYLETVHVASDRNFIDLRFPVQYVLRPDLNFRGYCGTVASGILRRGDAVLALPSGRRSTVKAIVTHDGEVEEAFPPMAVTVTLSDELDISRGDLLAHPHNLPRTSHELEAMLVWMDERALALNQPYLLKHVAGMIQADVVGLRYRMNVNTLHREPADTLALNEIGRVALRLRRPLAHDAYARNRACGAFVLIDRLSNATVAAGMILDREPDESVPEHRAADQPRSRYVRPPPSLVTPGERASRLRQKPCTVWLSGLPKSGKTTLAVALERRLFDLGCQAHILDGGTLRLEISRDLGFSGDDRAENIRRAAGVARVCNDAGLITIAAFVSPFAEDRHRARQIIGAARFLEVYVHAPVEVCERRDDEGLYARARRGEIPEFSGVSAPYEEPSRADLVLPTHELDVATCVEQIVAEMRQRGWIGLEPANLGR